MGSRAEGQTPRIEPIHVTDVFATALAPVEYCGEYVRLSFYRKDHGMVRLWLPAECYRECVLTLLEAPSLVVH